MKIQKGYSMIVLVIAITVILILASSAISMLQVSREKTAITNFIFDITTVEEEIQDFYTSTGTLPVKTYENVDMQALNTNEAKGILSQLYVYDNDNYYDVDLSQLGTISVKDSERGYIVNEGSLKVYVKNGVEYKNFEFGDSGDSVVLQWCQHSVLIVLQNVQIKLEIFQTLLQKRLMIYKMHWLMINYQHQILHV